MTQAPSGEAGEGAVAAPPRRARRLRRFALELLVVAAVFLALRFWRTRDLIEGEFPAADVLSISGESLHLGKAQPSLTMVHVWATWCPTCRAMEGAVESVAEHVRVVSIAAQSGSDETLRAYASEHGLKVPVVNDARGTWVRALGVHAFPTTFLVDEDGRIVGREVGYTTAWGLRLRTWLARL